MRILLLEDDLTLCDTIEQALGKEGYSVDCCHDGETAMLYALNTDLGHDIAIVDRMLPIVDGLTIIKSMRRKGITIPVIIITGMAALDDRIEGLDGGADDYLVKPFHVLELLARVRALTRRPHEMKESNCLTYCDLTFDRMNRLLRRGGELELTLTGKETKIFDRFYCADKSRSDKAHFGLGLSIAFELSKMLGGTVGHTDTAGGGATFYVTLPLKSLPGFD